MSTSALGMAKLLRAAGREGAPRALVTVIGTSGSTPRHAGARMLVEVGGPLVGTIGGGKIELELEDAARAVALGERPEHTISRHLTRELAMCCGGRMTFAVEPVDASRVAAWAAAAAALASRRTARVVAVVDGAEVFAEEIQPAPRAILFGAGHVAHALAPLCAGVGFEVVVCDEDESYASAARFAGAQLVHSFDASEVARELGGLAAGDHVIVLTRDHAIDQTLIEQLVPKIRDLAYLGLIGSRGKVARFRSRLAAKGLGSDEDWARLHAPIGLDLGAETPEEIAVAIVAELVAHRRRKARA